MNRLERRTLTVAALEVIGDDIDAALVHADVVHRDDPGVVQLREPPRLLPRHVGVRRTCAAGA